MIHRRRLKDKEIAAIKFQSVEEYLEQGNKITILKPYKPEIKAYFGQNRNRNKPKRGARK